MISFLDFVKCLLFPSDYFSLLLYLLEAGGSTDRFYGTQLDLG